METLLTSADQTTLDSYRDKFRAAAPFPHIVFDNFLADDWAERVAASYPPFDQALGMGKAFETVNEHLKVQIPDSTLFSLETMELHETLASPEFLKRLGYVTGIAKPLADEHLHGGGIHQTGPHGRLDVHVDFNYIPDEDRHRRLNILVYLNKDWKEEWGGILELWDEPVKVCHASLPPILNRCVIFETSHRSFHGVTALTCPQDRVRMSFAAYYYTNEAPEGWDGTSHSTIFRARPTERMKRYFSMPFEKAMHSLKKRLGR